jgi:peptidyl-prolyl cis-trans isomerase A (cyclophilin A)
MRLAAIALTIIALFVVFGIGPAAGQEGAQVNREKLLKPDDLNEKAPDKFQVTFDTSKGKFTLEVIRAWSPNGADRFYNLVKNGYYNDCRFFRVIEMNIAQFGISGDPKLNAVWYKAFIKDDPFKQPNIRGYVSFATAGPNTRTTQLFINAKDNTSLDDKGFTPFGRVIKGMTTVDAFYDRYGEGAPRGKGPEQARIVNEGNEYLEKSFPRLDYIKTAVIIIDKPAKEK